MFPGLASVFVEVIVWFFFWFFFKIYIDTLVFAFRIWFESQLIIKYKKGYTYKLDMITWNIFSGQWN